MANKRTEIASTLNDFYAQPVARVSFELIITIVVVMFFALFAIRPTLLTMSDLIKEIDDKKALDTALDQKVAALSTGQSEYLTLLDRIASLDDALPTNPEVMEALSIIERIASDRQVAITNIGIPDLPPTLAAPVQDSITAPVAVTERKNLILRVTLASDYLTIQQFIKDLQESRRLIVVDAIEYNVNEEDADESLRATITVNMPYFGEPTAAPVEAAPAVPAGEGVL